MELLHWALSLGPWAIIVAVILGRRWIFAKIEKGVQHGFDKKLENLRSELRQNEDKLRSDLQEKQAELTALREAVLGGRAHRQTLLTKRQLEAVERIWSAINSFAQLKHISTAMASINFDEAAKVTPRDPNARRMFETILGPLVDQEKIPENHAINERPFVTQLAWAYFSAYSSIVSGAYVRAKMLAIGIEDAGKFLNDEEPKKKLKEALPEMAEFIDKHDSRAHHHLLDHIEERLLAELRKMLEGDEIDKDSLEKANKLMKAVSDLSEQQAKRQAALDQEDDKANPV